MSASALKTERAELIAKMNAIGPARASHPQFTEKRELETRLREVNAALKAANIIEAARATEQAEKRAAAGQAEFADNARRAKKDEIPKWLRVALAMLHEQIDQEDPDDPIRIALARAGLAVVPPAATPRMTTKTRPMRDILATMARNLRRTVKRVRGPQQHVTDFAIALDVFIAAQDRHIAEHNAAKSGPGVVVGVDAAFDGVSVIVQPVTDSPSPAERAEWETTWKR